MRQNLESLYQGPWGWVCLFRASHLPLLGDHSSGFFPCKCLSSLSPFLMAMSVVLESLIPAIAAHLWFLQPDQGQSLPFYVPVCLMLPLWNELLSLRSHTIHHEPLCALTTRLPFLHLSLMPNLISVCCPTEHSIILVLFIQNNKASVLDQIISNFWSSTCSRPSLIKFLF